MLIDGTPVPVCDVSRVGRPDGHSAGRQWHERGAEMGSCAARGWWFYGFKLVLTATVGMLPDRLALVPTAVDEREAALALLVPGLVLIGDRTFSRFAAATWRGELDHAGVQVIAPPARRRPGSHRARFPAPHPHLRRDAHRPAQGRARPRGPRRPLLVGPAHPHQRAAGRLHPRPLQRHLPPRLTRPPQYAPRA